MARVGEHRGVQPLAQPRALLGRKELGLDRRQREQGLAQSEGQPRPDLEDREVVLDQGGQRRLGLVVGRVGLEARFGTAPIECCELTRAVGVEIDDLLAAELHAGLDDHRQYPIPRLSQSCGRERVLVHRDRAGEILGAGHGECSIVSCAPPGTGTSVPIT